MKITRENLAKSRVKLTIEAPVERVKTFFDEAYKQLAPTVEIKGFRPGQAPKLLTIEAIGQGKYTQTALDAALQQVYYEAVQQEKIIPIQPPAVSVKEFAEDKPFSFEAQVDVVPQIKLGDYKKVKVKYKEPKIDANKEEVDKVINNLKHQAAAFKEVDRPAKNGDRVEIDFEGSVSGVKQDGLSSKNHPLVLGEGSLIAGFEKELAGLKKGEEKEFDLDVPHKTEKNKTQKTHFKVKMIDIKEVILPEENSEFAKKFGHDTTEKLRAAIAASIMEEKKTHDKQHLEQEVLEKVVATCKLEVPESLIEQEISRRLMSMQEQMGQGFPKYLESIGKKIEDIKKEMQPSAENSVKIGLVLGEIARAEGFVKGSIKDQKEQQEVIRKTIDKLVEITTK